MMITITVTVCSSKKLRRLKMQSILCCVESLSVIGHATQVNVPHRNSSQAGQYLIETPCRDGRLSWPGWLLIETSALATTPHHGHFKQFIFHFIVTEIDRFIFAELSSL